MVFFNCETKTLFGEQQPFVFHPNASLGEVLVYFLRKTPTKITQVSADDGIEVSCGEMADMTVNVAKNLIKLGYKPGDIIGIVGRNVTYSTPVIFGSYLLACPITPLDPTLTVGVMTAIYKNTLPEIIFCDSNVVENIVNVVASLGKTIEIVTLTDHVEGFKHVSEFLVDPGNNYEVPRNSIDASKTVATFLRTSGSTNEPKIAQVTHAQLLHPLTIHGNDENVFALYFNLYSGVTNTFFTVSAVINHEKRLITTSPFIADYCYDLFEKYEITHFATIPGHVRLLMQSPRYESTKFSSLRRLAVGGWHTPEELRKQMKEKLPHAVLVVGGGMTEIGGTLFQCDPDQVSSSAIGKPCPNTQVRVLMDDGSFGGFNDIGEIIVKRPVNFLGYINNDAETAKTIDNKGWLHTGDVGFFDESLNVTFLGRKAFIIRCGRNSFQPSELEDVIEKIAGVKDVCVVGVPDPQSNELPTAMVLKDANCIVTEDQIHDSIKHLEDYKQLRGGVFFVDEIALTITGKVKRSEIKEVATQMYKKRNSSL